MTLVESAAKRGTAHELLDALRRDKFVLYCQRIVPISSSADKSRYQEIFVRYLEEEQRLLPPGGFLPILESFNLMPMLDQWVIKSVIKWLVEEREKRNRGDVARCSVNLSAASISDRGLLTFVSGQIEAVKLPPGKLSFEIPEADAEAHALVLEEIIMGLGPIGCGFTLTSYTGEFVPREFLQALGVDSVKIDGRIVRNIHQSKRAYSKAQSIHQTCKSLGMSTVGELVEHQETLDHLRKLGVDYAQGYAIAKPTPLR